MPGSVATGLSSYRRQNLLTEFASLKHVQPQGIYVSLTPGDPSLWSGVLFVRDGPYAPAILRFRIFFPSAYPHTAPLVTFNPDIFHPLLFDATRSTQNTGDALNDGSERPPPGALNLRYAFTCWRKKKKENKHEQPGAELTSGDPTLPQNKALADDDDSLREVATATDDGPRDSFADANDVYVVDILRYMRSVFEDAALIDAIPFEHAANQSAWYAWRASKYSRYSKQSSSATLTTHKPPTDVAAAPAHASDEAAAQAPSTPAKSGRVAAVTRDASSTPKLTPKKPSEWKWEGVWEMRARKAVEASVTDASLYGANGLRDDEIHFVSADVEEIDSMRDELHAQARA